VAFEALLAPADAKPKRWRRRMIIASLIGHGILLIAGVAHSMWQVDELPMPSVQVTLVSAAPPPPPPPPPAKKKTKSEKKKPRQPKEEVLVQPKEIPQEEEEPEAQEEEEEGEEEGVEGGEQGGQVGGVIGGKVGSDAKVEKRKGPEMVSSQVGGRQLLSNPSSPANRPKVPRAFRNKRLTAVVRICANEKGRVTTVSVVKGSGTPVDSQLPSVMRRWRYKPLKKDGVGIPFCYHVNYVINER